MTRFILTAIAALLIVGALFLLVTLTGAAVGVALIGALIVAAIVGVFYLSLMMRRRRASRY
jgi:multisubunit Na+/H+ antiporter MnhB subunit